MIGMSHDRFDITGGGAIKILSAKFRWMLGNDFARQFNNQMTDKFNTGSRIYVDESEIRYHGNGVIM